MPSALDEPEVGAAKLLLLIESKRQPEVVKSSAPAELTANLGYTDCEGLVAWDIFDAMLAPGNLVLIMSFRDEAAANGFRTGARLSDDTRVRRVRVVRDYSMRDRREAPQYYPDVN